MAATSKPYSAPHPQQHPLIVSQALRGPGPFLEVMQVPWEPHSGRGPTGGCPPEGAQGQGGIITPAAASPEGARAPGDTRAVVVLGGLVLSVCRTEPSPPVADNG